MDEEIYHKVNMALRGLYRAIRAGEVINLEDRSRKTTDEILEVIEDNKEVRL